MNYEKFNDTMCKLKQAEEEFSKKLSETFKPFIEETKEQELQEKEERQIDLQAQIDEAYNKGLKDLHEAFRIIAAEDGMSTSDLKDAFGIYSVCGIILGFNPEEIIDKVNRWKAEKDKEEQEFHVGDEVINDVGTTGIITSFGEDVMWITYRATSKARGFDYCWFKKDSCKKTGRHFDSIPFDYNSEKDD